MSALHSQIGAEEMRHSKEVHRLKKEMVELRNQIEHTFRNSIEESDRATKQNAFDALSLESKTALLTNAKIKEELAMQMMGAKNFTQRNETQIAQRREFQAKARDLEVTKEATLVGLALLYTSCSYLWWCTCVSIRAPRTQSSRASRG